VRRRNSPRPISFALDTVGDRLEPATLIAKIQRHWPHVAGSFAGSCEPRAENDGELIVDCDSAVQAQELHLMSDLVVERLNEALGQPAVKRLRPRATRT
jgi:predicted nucleic acid-binding Zn ribbon protein